MGQDPNLMNGPLSGYRIVDLTTVVLGPYATRILGDLGADVVKVEPPEGDMLREIGPRKSPGMAPIHLALGSSKRSVVLDLKRPRARDALMRLVAGADAFVHSMRPGAIARLGLTYDEIRAVRPDIVYCGACGFGSGGPYAGRPAYDDLIQGMCGIADLMGRVTGGPPRYAPTIVADKTVGLFVANAVLAALLHRERTGEGQEIEVPMYETMVSYVMVEHLWERAVRPDDGAVGYVRMLAPNRRPFRTRDGYLCMLAYTDRHWKAFFALAGRPELSADPASRTSPAGPRTSPSCMRRPRSCWGRGRPRNGSRTSRRRRFRPVPSTPSRTCSPIPTSPARTSSGASTIRASVRPFRSVPRPASPARPRRCAAPPPSSGSTPWRCCAREGSTRPRSTASSATAAPSSPDRRVGLRFRCGPAPTVDETREAPWVGFQAHVKRLMLAKAGPRLGVAG